MPDPAPPDDQGFLDRALAAAFGSALETPPRETGSTPAPPEEAPLHAGRFRILEEIARGGGGIVYRAHDPELERDVAIKVLRGGARTAAEARERFLGEVRLSGRLEHPGIVPVYEHGALPGGEPFYAMRLVAGRTLAALLQERTDPGTDVRRFLTILEGVAQAVGFAHSLGVIHRDLKPSNVMVGAFGEVQVMDWGLAKVLAPSRPGAEPAEERNRGPRPGEIRSSGSTHSVTGSVMGTPQYMAPEQARGEIETMDARSDVFALGAILCEVLTGRPPFGGERREALRRAAAAELEPAWRSLEDASADADLVALARSALAPLPADRPRNAKELADALGAHFATVDERMRRAELEAETTRIQVREELRRRRLRVGLFLALLLAVGVAGFAALTRRFEAERRLHALSIEVQDALEVASTTSAQAAAAARGDDLALWERARGEVAQAERLLATGAVTPGLEARVRELGARIERARGEAVKAAEVRERDAAMRRRLEAVRMPTEADPRDYQRLRSAYEEAFAAYGLALDAPVPDALRAAPIAPDLARALDEWALLAFVYSGLSEEERRARRGQLLERAAELDPDPDRVAIRTAIHEHDGERLAALAADDVLARLGPEALDLLFGGLRFTDRPELAVRVLRAGTLAHPGDYWLNLHLASVLKDAFSDREREALGFAYAALGARGGSVEARHLVGDLLELTDGDALALEHFRNLAEREPDGGHWRAHLARNLMRLGKPEEARVEIEAALPLAPEDAHVWFILGNLEADGGRPLASIDAYRKSLALGPDHVTVQRQLVMQLLETSAYREAEDWLRAIVVREPSAVPLADREDMGISWYNLGRTREWLGDAAGCEDAYRTCLRFLPNMPEAHCNLGLALMKSGRPKEALAEYRRGHELGSARPGWSYPSAEWVRESESRVALSEHLEAFAEGEYEPRDSLERYELALLGLWHGLPLLASATFEQALAEAPELAADPFLEHRWCAARAAALASRGAGDAAWLSAEERARQAGLALDWIEEDVEILRAQVAEDPSGQWSTALQWVSTDRLHPDFACVRDPELLAAIGPPAEALLPRARALWAELDRFAEELLELERDLEAR